MSNLYLIICVAGQRVALAADSVESVVEIDAITPVPMVAPHVAGLAALRSRVLTIVDSHTALGLGGMPAELRSNAVIVTIEGHLYGLLVDKVEDVVTADGGVQSLRVPLGAGWSRMARGMIEHEGNAILLLDPAALVAGAPAQAA